MSYYIHALQYILLSFPTECSIVQHWTEGVGLCHSSTVYVIFIWSYSLYRLLVAINILVCHSSKSHLEHFKYDHQ